MAAADEYQEMPIHIQIKVEPELNNEESDEEESSYEDQDELEVHSRKRTFSTDEQYELISFGSSSSSSDTEDDADQTTDEEIGDTSRAEAWWWTCKDNEPKIDPFTGNPGCKIPHLNSDSSSLDVFLEFWTPQLIQKIVKETNAYAESRSKTEGPGKRWHIPWTPVTADEIKAFIALTLLMGVVKKPDLDMYWSPDPLLSTPFFSKTIPRNRYRTILTNLRFNSAENDGKVDNLHKIRPVVDILRDKFKTVYFPTENISVNESPIKISKNFKFYKLNQSDGPASGYTWNFEVYTGENENSDGDRPASSRVVFSLAGDLLGFGHNIFMGSWFSSPDLFAELRQHGANACGSVRMSRRHFPIELRKAALKEQRVSFRSSNNNILCLVCKNKQCANMLSTMHTSEMICTGKMHHRTNDIVLKPKCVIDYVSGMSGANMSDHLAGSGMPVRRWYKRVFYYLLDLTIINSFVVNKFLGGKFSAQEFKMSLISLLLESATLPSYQVGGRPGLLCGPKRLTGRHFLESVPATEKRRSRSRRCEVCKSRNKRTETRFQCDTCKVALCIYMCHKEYHTKQTF